MQFGLAQAKARLSELTSLVDAGEEVVIAKHGRPSYKLVLATSLAAMTSSTTHTRQTPTNLGEMNAFIEQIRNESILYEIKDNFVAEWRQDARY
jgi:antitoxin (DNA-binding transcriptional repressor) of toxin-antitoxin stability system